jgi:[ribosomal protein S5]-alanine N-acetyltransferase
MIETERLTLREFTDADLDKLVELRSDPLVSQYIGGEKAMDREWNRSRLAFHIACYKDPGYGMMAMHWKETGDMIGWCGLQPLEESGHIEIGYGMSQPFWGKGIAYEASLACLREGFEKGLERIVAVASPENNNSWGTMIKLGMKREPDAFHYGHMLVFYAISKEDFFAIHGR